MSDLIEKYIEEIDFEPIIGSSITKERIESLKSKEGLVIEGTKTDLWIFRKLSIHNILGINTVMENADSFVVMDSFGMQIWSGDTNSVLGFVQGFLKGSVGDA